MRTSSIFGAVAVVALAANPVNAQLANASASTLALGGNNTATVRGFGAISVNPAGLAMPGSGFSLALVPIQARAGLGPVTLSDLADYEGVLVPTSTKDAWMTSIENAGGQSGSAGADVTGFALTFGNIGLQVSSIASSSLNIPAGAAEAILYGNAGRTGAAQDLVLDGAAAEGFAMSTAGLSVGFPFGPGVFGVTGKYSVGHAVAIATADGLASTNPLQIGLDVSAVASCDDEIVGQCTQDFMDGGSGFSADVGFMMDLPALSIGASILNLFSTFAWNQEALAYRPGTVLVEQDTSAADFDEAPLATAPASLIALLDDFTLKPTLQMGAAMDLPIGLTVSADIHRRMGEGGIAFGPKSHVGVGAEFRGLGVLHLRAGGAVITGGTQYGGGASLVLGPVNLSGALAKRQGNDLEETILGQFTLSIGNR
jgi:hypothetical protein